MASRASSTATKKYPSSPSTAICIIPHRSVNKFSHHITSIILRMEWRIEHLPMFVLHQKITRGEIYHQQEQLNFSNELALNYKDYCLIMVSQLSLKVHPLIHLPVLYGPWCAPALDTILPPLGNPQTCAFNRK